MSLVFGHPQQLNMVYLHCVGIAVHRGCFNALFNKQLSGLSRREPGCNVEEQSLVGTSTREQKTDSPGIA